MATYRIPLWRIHQVNSSGTPLSGCKLYVYQSGTTTAVSLFSDSAGGSSAANPIVADSTGLIPVRYTTYTGALTLVLKTSADVTIWSDDNISTGLGSAETISGTAPVFYFHESDGGANAKYWRFMASAEVFTFACGNDALDTFNNFFSFARSAATPGALAFGGTSFKPAANDGASLGVNGTAWSDIFLASGAVIDWGGGDITLTYTANTWALAGGTSYTIEGIDVRDETWDIASSDETTALTTGTLKSSLAFPYAVTVVSVGCSVNTAGTGLTVDINEAGTTILSTKLTLDSGEKTSLTAAVPAVISDTTIAAGAEVSVDIDAASGTSKGLKVWMIVRRTS